MPEGRSVEPTLNPTEDSNEEGGESLVEDSEQVA